MARPHGFRDWVLGIVASLVIAGVVGGVGVYAQVRVNTRELDIHANESRATQERVSAVEKQFHEIDKKLAVNEQILTAIAHHVGATVPPVATTAPPEVEPNEP